MTQPGERERLEGLYTAHRILELRLNPVGGKFDAYHLREINRRIFQDLPALGFKDVFPGQYRTPVPHGKDWIKTRSLETVSVALHVAYSAMDRSAQAQLDQILKKANPAVLGKLKSVEFTEAISQLYAEIDYIHPFGDGNSRTLREFTRELAEKSGYTIDWERLNKVPAGRDLLYIARDRSVNELALPHIRHISTKRDVLLSMDQFEGNMDLTALLNNIIRPIRTTTS